MQATKHLPIDSAERKLQALQSILSSDFTPKDIDCREIGQFENYRMFYIAVYSDKFEYLGISKDIECEVIMDTSSMETVYISADKSFFGFSDRKSTYINNLNSTLWTELTDLEEKFLMQYDGKRCDNSDLKVIFEAYMELYSPNDFCEIDGGNQIPELG